MHNAFEIMLFLYCFFGILCCNSWLLKKGVISPVTTHGKVIAILFGFLSVFFFFAGAAVMLCIACIADAPRIFSKPTPPH